MKRFFTYVTGTYLHKSLDFRVRLFNVLAMAGTLISLVMAVLGIVTGAGLWNIAANLLTAGLSFALLTYSQRTGHYQFCYTVTITAIFLILFPVLFFTAGGYHSGMPAFFVFAVAFTVFMLDGKRAVLFSFAETAIYVTICLVAYRYPQTVLWLDGEQAILTDVIVAFVVVSAALGVSMFLHFKLYNAQQAKLDEQNQQLAEVNRMKTEFFASISHEMKTPLTVISVHVQRAQAFMELGREGDAEKVRESHALAQEEVMRLSRLVDGALRLSSIQELGGARDLLNMWGILHTTAEAYRALAEKSGNTLTLLLPDNLPPVSGSADALVQLLSNLLSNSIAHTMDGEITLCASYDGGTMLNISIADSGEGIPPELLNRVFERGVSGGGGSGLGLAICMQIVTDHGGEIILGSEPGKGTTVTVTLPVWEDIHE